MGTRRQGADRARASKASHALWLTLLPLALTLPTGCAGPQVVRAPRAAAPSYALVRRGAWFRVAPSADAAGARDPLWAGKPYKLGRATTMELLGRDGDWVAVRPVLSKKGEPAPCIGTVWALRRLDIRLWVRAEELVPVVRQQTGYAYDDGTSIVLRAGVPAVWNKRVSGRGRSIYAVRAGRFRFNTVLNDRRVGRSFRRTKPFHNTASDERLVKKAELRFGTTARVLDRQRWSWLYVQDRQTTPRGELVVVRSRCASLKVMVKPEEIVAVPQRGVGGLGMLGSMSGGGPPAFTIPADTPLTWVDGAPAGRTHGPLKVRRPAPQHDDELRRCFAWSLRTFWPKRRPRTPDADLLLCAPRARVERP